MIAPFPTTTRQQIFEMIEQDGRDITFYVVDSTIPCPTCSLDPITNTSTDSYCPTCSGVYWIDTLSGWTVNAHVFWGKSENKDWETGGVIDNGDCSVKFIYSGGYEDIVHSSQYVVVDSRNMNVDRIILRGVPEINRIIVLLKEKEKQDG